MTAPSATPTDLLAPLRRTRQYREFEPTPLDDATLDALADVARWSGSSQNSQPWRFIVIRDKATLERISDIGKPQTRGLATAPNAIAIAMPEEAGRAVSHAFDEGRVAERLLIAASILGIGAGISWIKPDLRPEVAAILGIPDGWSVRTVVQVGHPTEAARRPKSAPGEARRPREEIVFVDRWGGR
jgi:nitroreductase